MVPHNNPAGRLHRVLVRLRDLAGKETVGKALKKALDADGALLPVAMHGVFQAVSDLYDELQSLDGEIDIDTYVTYIPRWTKFLVAAPQSSSAQYSANDVVDSGDLDYLGSLAHVLHYRKPEGVATEEDLSNLHSKLHDLINEIAGDHELDTEFRVFVLEHLQRADEAIRLYWIYGPDRFDEVFGRFFNDAVRRRSRWSKESESTTWAKVKQFFGILPTFAARTDDAVKAIENTQTLLEMTNGNFPST